MIARAEGGPATLIYFLVRGFCFAPGDASVHAVGSFAGTVRNLLPSRDSLQNTLGILRRRDVAVTSTTTKCMDNTIESDDGMNRVPRKHKQSELIMQAWRNALMQNELLITCFS